MQLSLSDSRDMGYRKNFLSIWHNRSPEGQFIKGNSVRMALSSLIRREREMLNTEARNAHTKTCI
jgi:hypothetical protein